MHIDTATTVQPVTTSWIQTQERQQTLNAAKMNTLRAQVKKQIQRWQNLSLQQIKAKIQRLQPQHVKVPHGYPIRSPLLTPGKVNARRIHARLARSFFIVGEDARSKAWLQRHHRSLAACHAQGIIVNIRSPKALQALRKQYPRLSLIALPGNVLATKLNLKHYPVLITARKIMQ